ncbi:hypothetical protein O3P69_015966 [Scylla paramamosain]|uniref:Single domain-containing protein n=1 Tax=Scylla paramamosain TaxID=85552 RepID=A0AAW0T8G1_SCYPA
MVSRVVVNAMVMVVMAVVARSQRPFKDHSRSWDSASRPPLGHSDAHFIHQEGPRSSFSLRTLSPHKDISYPPPPALHPSGPVSFSGLKEEDIFRPKPRPLRPPPSRHKHHHIPPRHSKPHHSLPPPQKPHHSSPPHKPPHHSPPPQHSELPHHNGPPQTPHRKTHGAIFTTTVHEHKNEGPGGCQTKEGFYFAGQTWFVKGCRRRKCIHFRGKFLTETDSCDSEIFNTTYRCVIQVDTTADFPRCCPTYKCNPDNLGNSV